jgi:hypothetical protein
MEIDNYVAYFSKLELVFIDKFIKYISHCSSTSNCASILNDNKLQVYDISNDTINDSKSIHKTQDKIFCSISDVFFKYDNPFCNDMFSVEYQLDKSLLLKYKYYILHNPQEYGGLERAEYISPYLFNIIKNSEFDKTKFKININKEKTNDPMIVFVLLDEIDGLFESKVVKEKYNPPISVAFINSILNRKKDLDQKYYSMTVAFLGHVELENYLNRIVISENLLDFNKKEIVDILPVLNKRKIPYLFKKWNTFH